MEEMQLEMVENYIKIFFLNGSALLGYSNTFLTQIWAQAVRYYANTYINLHRCFLVRAIIYKLHLGLLLLAGKTF